MSVMVAEVITASQCVPSTGFGGVSVAHGSDIVTSGSEVYTATTCTATWSNPVTGATVGQYVVTQDGYWGVLQSNASATVATVDSWRFKDGSVGIPTAGQDCRIYNGKGILVGTKQTRVHRIVITHTAAATFAITDPWGNVLYLHTPLAGTTSYTLEFCTGDKESGLVFPGAIGFKCSATTTTAVVMFST